MTISSKTASPSTDIIVGWCLNWARRLGHLDEFPALRRYVQRLLARPLCALAQD